VSGGSGVLGAWFDFNNNNSFEPGEFYNLGSVTGQQVVSFTPPAQSNTTVNARFRLFDVADIPGGSLDAGDFTGGVNNGEVEDYQWSFGPTAVNLSSFNANNNVASPVGLVIVISLILAAGSFIIIRRRKATE